MPNWCMNTLTLKHEDPAMVERALNAFNEGKLLNEFVPIPESLHIVAGSVGDGDEQAALEAQTELNRKTHGYGNWYDFCVAEWGTKWDVGGDGCDPIAEDGSLSVTFDSAWAPPLMAYEKMAEMGFDIRAMYYEPGMAFAGTWTNDGGDEYHEYGDMSSEQVAEELPEELDAEFGISEQIAEWEAEQAEDEFEDIDLDGGLSAINEQDQLKE